MSTSEGRSLVTEIQDRLLELYVEQDEARRAEDRDRAHALQAGLTPRASCTMYCWHLRSLAVGRTSNPNRRDTRAALRLMCKLLKKQGFVQEERTHKRNLGCD